MFRKSVSASIVLVILVVVLMTPALPIHADGLDHPAGLFGWLDTWLTSFTTWGSDSTPVTLDTQRPKDGLRAGEPQPVGDLNESTDLDSERKDSGPSIDPLGWR